MNSVFLLSYIASIVLYPIVASAIAPLGLDGSDIIFRLKGPDTLSGFGRRSVCSVGDINGDGYSDFAFTRYRPDASSLVFLGGATPDTNYDYILSGMVWGEGDFTGDGIDEIVTSAYCEPSQPRGIVYFYRGYGDSIGSAPYDSLWTTGNNYARGQVVRLAYVDSDNLCDLLVCQPYTPGGPTILYYSGGVTLDTIPDWSTSITANSHYIGDFYDENFGFVDFDGDGHKDIFVGWLANLDSASYVAIFFGPDFQSSPDLTIWLPGEPGFGYPKLFTQKCVANIGDITGDGFDDLTVYVAFDDISRILIYSGGPLYDSLFDYMITPACEVAATGGDVNGDGYNDLITGVSYRSADGGIEVYLGGPRFDVYSDGHLVRQDLPPYFLQQIGWKLASAGDVNGDGFGDIIFSSDNFSNDYVGAVFVAQGGSDIVTGLGDSEISLPVQPTLHPNYPNPFNPSTTISFDLPRKSRVTLTVVNILGQEIVRLVDKEVSAGSHSVEWDGRDESREPVASGVYLYRLSTDNGTLSRKMLLLK